ncbi:MAG TPA: chromosome partitioning protein ParB [Rhodospirillaceae bacterium]|nr:chromosome partitioning protein ParB [Rhodospirillaceae bacterium]
MNAKPSSKPAPLGRGLSALFGDTDSSYKPRAGASGSEKKEEVKPRGNKVVGSEFINVSIHNIVGGMFQSRRRFDDDSLKELAESISAHGVIQPLILRSLAPETPDMYEIIAGERRWRAAQMIGLHQVPAIVRTLDNNQAMEANIIENVQREDLSPLEEAEGYQRLIEEFNYSHERIAFMIGKSRPHIANTLRLLKLPRSVQTMLLKGELTAAHARTVITAADPEALAKEIVEKKLSARQAEALAKSLSDGKHAKKNISANGRGAKSGAADPNILALERDIGNALGLKIKINVLTDSSGTLTVHYQDLDQLEHVLKKLQA